MSRPSLLSLTGVSYFSAALVSGWHVFSGRKESRLWSECLGRASVVLLGLDKPLNVLPLPAMGVLKRPGWRRPICPVYILCLR